jgi:hypothetical protein
MNQINKIVFVAIVLLLSSCQGKSDKANKENVIKNVDDFAFAKSISHNILKAQREGDFYKLNEDEASTRMISGLNESVQKSAYQQIKLLFGDYKDLTFHSKEDITKGETYAIYRFKGEFENGLDVEIRTVINTDGKLAGFFVKPWQEAL